MKTFGVVMIAAAALLAATAFARGNHASPPAKLTKMEAQSIALEAASGKVVSVEYEKENGAWRYSFDILQGDRIHEIGVDANTGEIVEDSYEDVNDND